MANFEELAFLKCFANVFHHHHIPMARLSSLGFLFSRYLATLSPDLRLEWSFPVANFSMTLYRSWSLTDLTIAAFFFSLAEASALCIKLSRRFRLADRFIRTVSWTFSLLWDSPSLNIVSTSSFVSLCCWCNDDDVLLWCSLDFRFLAAFLATMYESRMGSSGMPAIINNNKEKFVKF